MPLGRSAWRADNQRSLFCVDALGNLVRVLLLPGQTHDMKGCTTGSKHISFDARARRQGIRRGLVVQASTRERMASGLSFLPRQIARCSATTIPRSQVEAPGGKTTSQSQGVSEYSKPQMIKKSRGLCRTVAPSAPPLIASRYGMSRNPNIVLSCTQSSDNGG